MITAYNKYKNIHFFRIFLESLKYCLKNEFAIEKQISRSVAKMDTKQMIHTLAKIEPDYIFLPEDQRIATIAEGLQDKYQEQCLKHRKKLRFFRNITTSRMTHLCQLERFTKKIYPSFNQGACTAIPMSVLMQQSENPLRPLLFDNKAALADPKALIAHIKQAGYDDCLYETSPEHNFQNIFTEHQVKKGAFIIIDLDRPVSDKNCTGASPDFVKLIRAHTMIYTQNYPKTRTPLFISFDDNRYCISLSQKRQCGYVIDWQKIAYFEAQKSRNE